MENAMTQSLFVVVVIMGTFYATLGVVLVVEKWSWRRHVRRSIPDGQYVDLKTIEATFGNDGGFTGVRFTAEGGFREDTSH